MRLAETFEDRAAVHLRVAGKTAKGYRSIVRDQRGVDGAGNGAARADRRLDGLGGDRLMIGRHKFGRARMAAKSHLRQPRPAQIEHRLAMPVDVAVNVRRQFPSHLTSSHSLTS